MSAARILQRAIERSRPRQAYAVTSDPTWLLYASFEALDAVDDTMGTDELPALLASFETEGMEALS